MHTILWEHVEKINDWWEKGEGGRLIPGKVLKRRHFKWVLKTRSSTVSKGWWKGGYCNKGSNVRWLCTYAKNEMAGSSGRVAERPLKQIGAMNASVKSLPVVLKSQFSVSPQNNQ